MAAQQLTGEPRVCACGCGASLEGRHALTVYTRDCRERLKLERDVARHRRKAAARRERKSVSPLASAVWRGTNNDARHVPTPTCATCGSQSWRVVGPRCRCGLMYAPEPPIERGSLLRSSAGTAARHGALYGAERAKPGEGNIGEGVESSRAGKAKGKNHGS